MASYAILTSSSDDIKAPEDNRLLMHDKSGFTQQIDCTIHKAEKMTLVI